MHSSHDIAVGADGDQWLPVLGLAAVFGVMNLGLYGAIERIGSGWP